MTLAAAELTDAQPTGRIWRIAFISVALLQIERVCFKDLRILGYVEGENLIAERRYSEGRAELFRE